jgi:hypothetical protein
MHPPEWTHAASYRAQLAKLREHIATISADEFVGLPGFAPKLWLSIGVRTMLSRTAEPSLPGRRWALRLGALRFVLKKVWHARHLGAFGGKLAPTDIVVESFWVELVIDDGELAGLQLVAVLTESELLLADANEFELGPDYWADRAIAWALLIA